MTSPSTPSPTHRLVWNPDALQCDHGDPTIAAENAAVCVTFAYATTVHLALDERTFEKNHPAGLDAFRRLAPVADDERLFRHDGERRARLPEHADELATILDFDDTGSDGDVWAARLFGLDEFAVLDGERWRYHSIPHETWCRELYGDDESTPSRYLADVERALDEFPGVAVFPADEPLCAWSTAGADYELTPEVLRLTTEASTSAFRLRSLDYVRAEPTRLELACQWRRSNSSSLPRRLVRRLVSRFTADPPTRLRFETRAELNAAVDALHTVREKLDYAFRVE
ncbi:hypothetical protein [Halogranum rubrum]|uniref:Uncharacterized protein n=1 Tax=Halogranum salarium B-1 TaxID=1210908 RepID=J3F0A5_9EURY|nr:hypothetical protein [Halogranum salarium]EJN61477.1 hypothetical protein HSB1_05180 [Halogranum salarium B-1]